jgi:hypothetical protein
MTTPWHPNGTAFFWVPKSAFEKIENSLELAPAASAKLVFMALCVLANREGSATFTKPLNYLATLASVSRRTAWSRLGDLERLKLVTVERGKLRQAHRYTVQQPLPNVVQPLPNDRQVSTLHTCTLPKEPGEQKNRGSNPKPKPLTTGERIGLKDKLTAKKDKLADVTEGLKYEDGQKREKLKAEQARLKAEVCEIKERLGHE